MARKKRWKYTDAAWQKVGLMICCHCHKKIEKGEYRFHETAEAYIPQHRNCCPNDPKWEEIDNEKQTVAKHSAEFLTACLEFKDKWGVSDLDELIAELKGQP